MKKVLIPPPHGGNTLVNRILPEIERDWIEREASRYKTYIISNADLSVFYRIADGTLSPLEGPMESDEFYRVLDEEIIERNGKKYAWTIPIAFPVFKKDAEEFEIGETVIVRNESGKIVGTLTISDIYYFDKKRYNKSVYGTERIDHPGPHIFNRDPRDYLLGGKIWAFPQNFSLKYRKYMLTPIEARALFRKRGWDKIIAFQTRNPLHRAHEYAIVYAMEKLTKEGFFTGGAINPLLGATKSDDVTADIRMKTYEALIKNRLLGYGDKDEKFWQEKGYDLDDQLLLIGLDMKMFYAGPKEAIMHAIYRQNCGFTHIIIGRKHADAPFDDGTPAWGDFEAHKKFDELKGELKIQPIKVGFAAYFEEIERVGLIEEFEQKGYTPVNISGKELRKKLANGESVDERIMRKPVADILREYYFEKDTKTKSRNIVWHDSGISKREREKRNTHKGIVIWLTGLPSSGKSTIAVNLQSVLFNMGCWTFVLDGDNVRHGLNRDLGFSPEDRQENIRRVGEVAKLFTDAGCIVITAFISPYKRDRDRVRKLLPEGDFIEVFIKAPLSICKQRDPKGLYEKAEKGEIPEFTGISAPYEEPELPELVIDTEKSNVKQSVQVILDYLISKGIIKS